MKRTRKLLALVVTLVFVLSFSSIALAEPYQETVEGQGDHFVTGESYPTFIQMAGYNSRDENLYMNFTAAAADGALATFNYYLGVFDGEGAVLGTEGAYDNPTEVTEATVTNLEVNLGETSLTTAYRVVVTVTSHTVEN